MPAIPDHSESSSPGRSSITSCALSCRQSPDRERFFRSPRWPTMRCLHGRSGRRPSEGVCALNETAEVAGAAQEIGSTSTEGVAISAGGRATPTGVLLARAATSDGQASMGGMSLVGRYCVVGRLRRGAWWRPQRPRKKETAQVKGLLPNTTVWTAMVMVGFFPAYWQLRQFRRELRETIAEIRADREMRRERLVDGAPTWV